MNNLEIIASIYAATLSPHRFEETVAELEQNVVNLVRSTTGIAEFGDVLPEGRGREIDPALRETLSRHVENALAIQARLEVEAEGRDARLSAMLGIIPNPAVVFDETERILFANRQAGDWRTRNLSLAEFLPKDAVVGDVRDAIDKMRRGSAFVTLPILVDSQRGTSTCMLLKQLSAEDGAQERSLYMLSIVDFGFSDEIASLFAEAYGLTSAETAVALGLASGKAPADLAASRSVSLDTVRAQIKAVKHKTGVRDIPDLVRLLCGYSMGVVVPTRYPGLASPEVSRAGSAVSTVALLKLRDGRTMEYSIQGASGGDPVLLLHNMPYGQFLPEAAAAYAARQGVTVHAPFRPGCRGSSPLRGPRREAWLEAVTADTLEFMDRMDISRARVIGNAAGATFGVHLAMTAPERVGGIVMVSRAPVWRPEWLSQLRGHQRLMSMLIWVMPSMADMFIRAIVAFMKKQSAGEFLASAANGSAADLQALRDPEVVRLLATGVLEGFGQGGETFCKDWETMEIDQTAICRSLRIPIHVVHGGDDRIIDPQWSVEFGRQVPAATVEIVSEAGHYLFYSHWRAVMEAVDAMAAPAPRAFAAAR